MGTELAASQRIRPILPLIAANDAIFRSRVTTSGPGSLHCVASSIGLPAAKRFSGAAGDSHCQSRSRP